MRYRSKESADTKLDMTPMIDMTFQLIAFFMVLINFSEADQDQRITLPSSELAKPPEAPLEMPLFLHLTKAGKVIFAGEKVSLEGLQPLLMRERQVIDATPGRSASQATVIIRADRSAKTGRVQEVIEVCQKTGFEKFALRAKYEEST